jgi:chromosome segregation ATPase
MARQGILYEQVAATAVRLAESGEIPTVDKVREALGNTGSKSTIAPLLKRWKNANANTVSDAQSALPQDLVNAVKHLYEQAQSEADRRIEEMQAELEDARAKMMAQLKEAEEETRQVQTQNQALDLALTKKNAEYASLQEVHQNEQVNNARIQAEKQGLELRLSDKQDELGALQAQLGQMRHQFEHFQEAAATRREEDRRQFEATKHALDRECAELRTQLANRDNIILTQAQQNSELSVRVEMLSSVQIKYQELQDTHAKLAQHLNTQTALAVELSNRHEQTVEALNEAQNTLAVLRNENPILREQMRSFEMKYSQSEAALTNLRIEQARLEQQLQDALSQNQQRLHKTLNERAV